MRIIPDEDTKAYIRGITNATETAQIEQYFSRQQDLGHRVEMPVSRLLSDGIYEIRPGPHRFLFFYFKGHIIIVHAFRKKTRKAPENEIKKAVYKRTQWHENG